MRHDKTLRLILTSDEIIYDKVLHIYDNEHSYDYYRLNAAMNIEDLGPAFMVGKAIMGIMKAHRHMTKDDTLLYVHLAKFTLTLSIEQRNNFD